MSDDDRDNDIENDANKRAHHNALERKRRENMKDSFTMLRDSLPFFQGDKVRATKAQILKKSSDYIQSMVTKHAAHQQDIDGMKKENRHLEEQILAVEKLKAEGNYAAAAALIEEIDLATSSQSQEVSSASFDADSEVRSDISDESKDSPRKRCRKK